MTDLLSVEDIKKALGAFAGEQPPSPSPLPSPTTPAPAPLRPCIPSGAPGAEGGGAGGEWESSACPILVRAGLGSVGKPCACPGHRKLGAAKGWVALLGGLESPPRSKTGVLGPGLPL